MEAVMSAAPQTEQEKQSFAEAALRLGGKSEEEAKRMGAVDKADEQVETLFAPQYQTSQSPIHRAIWDGKAPLELFAPPPAARGAASVRRGHAALDGDHSPSPRRKGAFQPRQETVG